MISSSRLGTLTAKLQEIWKKNMTPSWDSKYPIKMPLNYIINVQLFVPTILR